MMASSPSSSANETASQSFSNCSSPQISPSTQPAINDDMPPENPSPPILIEEPKSLSPSPSPPSSTTTTTTTTMVTTNTLDFTKMDRLPQLRLNTILASDPALQPEAKDIKGMVNEENSTNHHDLHLHRMHRSHSSARATPQDNCDTELMDDSPINENDSPPPLNNDVPIAAVIPNNDLLQRVPAFMCSPCGIKFSSLSTLEAHQTYYCSHR